MEYNFRQGLGKGLKFALTGLIALAAVSGFSEVTLWSLAEQYLKPALAALSVGGALTMALNFVKVRLGGVKGLLGLGK